VRGAGERSEGSSLPNGRGPWASGGERAKKVSEIKNSVSTSRGDEGITLCGVSRIKSEGIGTDRLRRGSERIARTRLTYRAGK